MKEINQTPAGAFEQKQPRPSPRLTRRELLKLSGIVMALGAIELAADPLVRKATFSTMDRQKETFSLADDKEDQPSEHVIQKTWERHFQAKGEKNFMSKEAWEYLGRSMGIFTNMYYAKERQERQNFEDYYEQFTEKLIRNSDLVGLDPDVFVSNLNYSAVQVVGDLDSQKHDVNISTLQAMGGAVTRHYGLDSWFTSKVAVKALRLPIKNLEFPLTYTQATRLLNTNITTGMMDYEISEKARAIYENIPENALHQFEQKYPDLAKHFRDIQGNRHALHLERSKLQEIIEEENGFIQLFGDKVLRPFFETSTATTTFAEIGIGDQVDDWQKTHYTAVWDKADSEQNVNSDKALSAEVIMDFAKLYKQNKDFAYKLLIKQQINNPKFIHFLERVAMNSNEESYPLRESVSQIANAVHKIDLLKRKQQGALYDCLAEEGKYEYNSDYQTFTAAALTKMLLNTAEKYFGPHEKRNKDETAFYAYIVSGIREWTPHYLSVSSEYGADPTIDAPYIRDLRMENFRSTRDSIKDKFGQDPKDNFDLLQIGNETLVQTANGYHYQVEDIFKNVPGALYTYMTSKPCDSGVIAYYYGLPPKYLRNTFIK